MSLEAVISFWQRVASDERLQAKVNPVSGAVPRLHAGVGASGLTGLSAIAREAGFACTPEEFAAAEAVMRFWEVAAGDKVIQERLKPSLAMESGAEAMVVRIAREAGFQFTEEQLATVTKALHGTGWMSPRAEVKGYTTVSPTTSYSTSLQLATSGALQTTFRRIGPGQVATYM